MAWTIHVLLMTIAVVSCLVCVLGTICWDQTLYNSVQPSSSNNWTDSEPLPSGSNLAKICPGGDYSSLTIRCQDNKKEGFTGYRNSSSYHYVATCTAALGMTCKPNSDANYTCPDFKAQFGCNCPTTTSSTTTVSTTGKQPTTGINANPSITNQPVGKDSSKSGSDARRDMRSGVLSVIVLLFSAIVL